MYLHELKNYCKTFPIVYQIYDNHIDGKDVDSDYLYDEDPEIPAVHHDLYYFPNQKDLIEKRYNYNVDVDFYKKILDKETYNIIKEKETNKTIKKGEIFKTTKGTHIVFIGNNHRWFHLGKKMYNIFKTLVGKEVIIVGGADGECVEDIHRVCLSIGIDIKRDWKYLWSASHTPL